MPRKRLTKNKPSLHMDLLIARIHKADSVGTALQAFSQLPQKTKHFTVPSAT